LPVPLTVAGEWLLAYRPFRLLRPFDAFAERIHHSGHALVLIPVIAILVFVLCYAVIS
jgi:hypothetical protein